VVSFLGVIIRLTNRAVSDGRAYTYTWSQRGQMLAEYTEGVPVRTFSYNGAGQMIKATVFTLTTEFEYNGLGARVAVSVAGEITNYALDYAAGNRILAETAPTSTVNYFYGDDCLGEFREDEPLYYLPDGEGYVRQGADTDGVVVGAWLFDPDGVVLEGPEGLVSHLVCGGVYDWSTGLLYQNGQYFDPGLGIWLALLPLAMVQSWPRKKQRRGRHPWMILMCILVVGALTGCPSPSASPTPTPTRTPYCNETPTLPPTFTPTSTSTPTPTPRPKTQWETQHGESIAQAAHELLANADQYYIWGADVPGHEGETYKVPPLRQVPQSGDIIPDDRPDAQEPIDIYKRTGGKTPIVCADVIDLSYKGAGLDLSAIFPGWASDAPYMEATRDVYMLGVLLRNSNQEYTWDDDSAGGMIELGDMVLSPDYGHSGVVAEISGSDRSQIYVIQASYGKGVIDKRPLTRWYDLGIHFGHPKLPGE